MKRHRDAGTNGGIKRFYLFYVGGRYFMNIGLTREDFEKRYMRRRRMERRKVLTDMLPSTALILNYHRGRLRAASFRFL